MSDDDIRARFRMLDDWARQVPDSTPDAAVSPAQQESTPSVPRFRDDELARRRQRRLTPLLTASAAAVVVLGVALLVTRGPAGDPGVVAQSPPPPTTSAPAGPTPSAGSSARPTTSVTAGPTAAATSTSAGSTRPAGRPGRTTAAAGGAAPPVDRAGATAAFARGTGTGLAYAGATGDARAPATGTVDAVTWRKGQLTVELTLAGRTDLVTARATCLTLAMDSGVAFQRTAAAATVEPAGDATRVRLVFVRLQPGVPMLLYGCDPRWTNLPLGTISAPAAGVLWTTVGGSSAYSNDHTVQHADVQQVGRSGSTLTVSLAVLGPTDVAPPDGTCLVVTPPGRAAVTVPAAARVVTKAPGGGAGGWSARFDFDLSAAAAQLGGPASGALAVRYGCRGDYTDGAVGFLG